MALTEQWTRVILLVPPALQGRGFGDSLQSQFAARDWYAIQFHDPYLALAELCLREKSQISRDAWGLQRLEQISLVVLEPAMWSAAGVELHELTAVVQRIIPSASLWHIVDEQIIAVQQAGVAQGVARSIAPQRAVANGSAALRTPPGSGPPLNGHHATIAAPKNELSMAVVASTGRAGEGADAEFSSRTRLSREEIEMLLDPHGAAESEVAS
jgi:hypothetical protein